MNWRHIVVYWGRWWYFPHRVKWLLCVALVLLCLSTLAIRLLPFRRVAPLLGEKGLIACKTLQPEQTTSVRDWAWALNTMARRLPWRATCLIRALAGQWWLRRQRIPATVYIGVAQGKTEGKHFFDAHAWLCCDDKILTGADEASRFKAIACFGTRGD